MSDYFDDLLGAPSDEDELDIDDADLFQGSRTTPVPVGDGEWVTQQMRDGSMGRFRIHTARLMRVSQRQGYRRNDNAPYKTVTGMFSGVSGEVEYHFTDEELMDGAEWITHDELFTKLLNRQTGKEYSPEYAKGVQNSWRCSLDSDTGVLGWMHFRANEEARNRLFDLMLSLPSGDEASTGPANNSIERAAQVFDEAHQPTVTHFDLRPMNRDLVQTGTGFLSIPDALAENMSRIISQRIAIAVGPTATIRRKTTQRKKLKGQLSEASDRGKLLTDIEAIDAEIEEQQDLRKDMVTNASAWANSWSGGQRRMQAVIEDEVVLDVVEDDEDTVDLVSALIPSFDLELANGESKHFEFWVSDPSSGATGSTDASTVGGDEFTAIGDDDDVDFEDDEDLFDS